MRIFSSAAAVNVLNKKLDDATFGNKDGIVDNERQAAGSAAGTSPTIACTTSHVCDGVSGTVTLTTGTSATTGTLATLGFPNTHTNQANCVVAVASSTGLLTTVTWSESTTALTLTANTALSNSTAYSIRYWCGGN